MVQIYEFNLKLCRYKQCFLAKRLPILYFFAYINKKKPERN